MDLETFKQRFDAPAMALEPFQTLEHSIQRIHAEQYAPDKQMKLTREATDAAGAKIAEGVARYRAERLAAADQEVAPIHQAVRRAHSVPMKAPTELDSQYTERLTRTMITELQAMRRATNATAYAALIPTIGDPAVIDAIFNEAFLVGDADSIRLLARVVVPRLTVLARPESEGGDPRATATLLAVQRRMGEWQAEAAERDPQVQEQRIRDRAQIDIQTHEWQVQSMVEKSRARYPGLQDAYDAALRNSALKALQAAGQQ